MLPPSVTGVNYLNQLPKEAEVNGQEVVRPIRASVGYYGVRAEDRITAHNGHEQTGGEGDWIVERNMDTEEVPVGPMGFLHPKGIVFGVHWCLMELGWLGRSKGLTEMWMCERLRTYQWASELTNTV